MIKNLCISIVLLLIALFMPARASAQTPTYDVAFWLAATADPNVTAPVAAPTNYAGSAITCGLAKTPRANTLVINPTQLRFDDPANPAAFDCQITIAAQVSTLPNDATQYRASARQVNFGAASAWGILTLDPFARNPPVVVLLHIGVS